MTLRREQIDVRYRGEIVAWVKNGRSFVSGKWDAFDGVRAALRRVVSRKSDSEKSPQGLEFRRELGNVLILMQGRLQFRMPDSIALKLLAATNEACRSAEQSNQLVVERQVADGALLARAGLPFGLTRNQRVKDMIANEAATNRDLRRYIRSSQVSAAPIPDPPALRQTTKLESAEILSEQHRTLERDLYGTD